MKKLLLMILTLATGCVSLTLVDVQPFSEPIRESARKDFASAVRWAADSLGWSVQSESGETFLLTRQYHDATAAVNVLLTNGNVAVYHLKSDGFRYSEELQQISLSYKRIASSLVLKIAAKCNSLEMTDADIADYKSQFRGIDAKGLSDAWMRDRRQMYTARSFLGMSRESWNNRDAETVEKLSVYERIELSKGETSITNGAIERIRGVMQNICSNKNVLANDMWANNTEDAKTVLAKSLCRFVACSNLFAMAGNGTVLGKESRIVNADSKGLRWLVGELLKKEYSACAQHLLTHYSAWRIGWADDRTICDLKRQCEEWEYAQTPEGKYQARKKEIRGEWIPKDFSFYCYHLKRENRHSANGRPIGLAAEGYADWVSSGANEEINETIRSINDPELKSRYIRESHKMWIETRTEVCAYEQRQVSIGLQEAFGVMKQSQKQDFISYVLSRVSKYWNTGGEVSQDETFEIVVGGMRQRVQMMELGFNQASAKNVFSSSFAAKNELRSYLKDVATSLVDGLSSMNQDDFIWRLGDSGMLEKIFMLDLAEVARLKALGRPAKKQVVEAKEDVAVLTGTGWFVNSNTLVTCYHVIENRRSLTCKLQCGSQLALRCVAQDKENDLAVLAIESGHSSDAWLPLQLRVLKLADKVCTFGYPLPSLLGQELKYTDGSVSGTSGIGNDPRLYQISVPLQPGNSGGALLNAEGYVVGVTSSGLNAIKTAQLTGTLPQNVNYAIKVRYLAALLDDNGIYYATDDAKCGFSGDNISEREKAVVLITAEK